MLSKQLPIINPYALMSMEVVKRIRWDKKVAAQLERIRQGIG